MQYNQSTFIFLHGIRLGFCSSLIPQPAATPSPHSRPPATQVQPPPREAHPSLPGRLPRRAPDNLEACFPSLRRRPAAGALLPSLRRRRSPSPPKNSRQGAGCQPPRAPPVSSPASHAGTTPPLEERGEIRPPGTRPSRRGRAPVKRGGGRPWPRHDRRLCVPAVLARRQGLQVAAAADTWLQSAAPATGPRSPWSARPVQAPAPVALCHGRRASSPPSLSPAGRRASSPPSSPLAAATAAAAASARGWAPIALPAQPPAPSSQPPTTTFSSRQLPGSGALSLSHHAAAPMGASAPSPAAAGAFPFLLPCSPASWTPLPSCRPGPPLPWLHACRLTGCRGRGHHDRRRRVRCCRPPWRGSLRPG
jgi:hypothetical protein